MEALHEILPSTEKGYLPYYLLVVSVAAIGNALQNLSTLHYTRRIYNGKFVPNPSAPAKSTGSDPEDSVHKLVPADPYKAAGKDQVTPLAARLFGTYTFAVGLIRLYAAYAPEHWALYQLGIWTHVIAAAHFTSELLVYKSIRFSGPQVFPFIASYVGTVWMVSQYGHYVQH
ncbi:hypothetical protein DL546_008157 [Coniochaeta pulveracea]|uniref:Ergosterol biosynthesis protein n=1 Tax=Coniochaeta pulveracea TaxID=177199 RepID=A0A420YLX1_9PEZI|nr:hypothetical protein DL546_008157 [Coniochaeta pulveracea]